MAAGSGGRATQRPQSSSDRALTAGAFGFLTLTQCGERQERYGELIAHSHAYRSDTISTLRRAKSLYMVWVWVVTTAFVVATFITVKQRGYKKMPHALRDAIAADAVFGALLLVHALL
jgi:hypothetical protein